MTTRPFALVLVTLTLAAAVASGRIPDPTTPGGGPGTNLFLADQLGAQPLQGPGLPLPQLPEGPPRQVTRAIVGGDDVAVTFADVGLGANMVVTTDGVFFAALSLTREAIDDTYIEVRRSTDGGTTWAEWATIGRGSNSDQEVDPCLALAEGNEDRLFVAYVRNVSGDDELRVAWSPLGLEAGDFSEDVLIHQATSVRTPHLITDAYYYAAYYDYLVFSANDGNGEDIHYARSVDMGSTWEPQYVIGAISVSDRGYHRPRVSYSLSGRVTVAWSLVVPRRPRVRPRSTLPQRREQRRRRPGQLGLAGVDQQPQQRRGRGVSRAGRARRRRTGDGVAQVRTGLRRVAAERLRDPPLPRRRARLDLPRGSR